MRDGTSQALRRPAALADHYFDADEQDLAHLMTLALAYAGQVDFVELGMDGKPQAEASWQPYFSGDETLAMAEILATRAGALKEQFERALAQADFGHALDPDDEARAALPGRLLVDWADRLAHWSDRLRRGGSAVGDDLGRLIAGLGVRLDRSDHFARLRAFHRTAGSSGDDASALFGAHAGAARAADAVRPTLRSLLHELLKAIEMSQAAAAQRLAASLASGTHDPGAGLLLAFLQLYRAAQDKLNRFTGRHLDFYYEQVLRMRPHGFVRDSTILLFAPSLPGARVTVARGAEFLAPVGNNKPDLVFTAEKELVVTDAAVAAVHTLYLERNRANSPESEMREMSGGQRSQYSTGAWLGTLPAIDAAQAVDLTALVSHPLFGEARDGAHSRRGAPARLGFVFASEVLLLHEGRRELTLVIRFAGAAAPPEPEADLLVQLPPEPPLALTFAARLAQLTAAMGNGGDTFYKAFRKMFKVGLTGPAGWIEVEEYSPQVRAAEGELQISFVLGDEQPAVVPYLPKLHGERYDTTAPLIRFELNRFGYLYPYGLLRDLPLRDVRIEVEVTGHRQLLLYNSVGQLSATGPFNPFGPLPEVGSYLIVGSAETARKRLTHFELELEWGGLPADPGGLRGYYAGYRGELGYGDVQVAVTALADGKWLPRAAIDQPWLTVLKPVTDPLGAERIGHAELLDASATLPYARPLTELAPDAAFAYTPGAKGGFFKFTLAGPAFAFGHKAYPFDLSDALSYNSGQRFWRRPRVLPNPPYTPLVNAVAVNYRASALLAPDRHDADGRIFRLHPLGWDRLGHGDSTTLLLPSVGFSGNLVVGLRSAAPAGVLSLYFHLREDALPLADSERRQLSWFYLAGNVWRRLEPRRVLADSTRGFLRPGIVHLELPADISNDNTLCQPGLYWLKVSAETGLREFCSLYSVHTQALLVSRQPAAADDPETPVLIPAATIRRPRQAIAGLGKVTQVAGSFGGRPPEDRMQLRVRTAERLRHKQRAILADDYERLILEQFPEIDKVKCFPHLSMSRAPNGTACPGHVLLVGLPRLAASGHALLPPTLNGYLVGRVRDFIAPLASQAVTIEVRNPVYQQIQVRCLVRLAPGSDEGRCLNQLDQAISDFISPWHPAGNTTHFGWCLHQHEIEAYILSFDFVEAVTKFSMLSIIGHDNHEYTLYDTAVPERNGQAEADIVPKYPWCVAVPIGAGHVIRSTESRVPVKPIPVGVGDLSVGSTFIISPRRTP